MDISSTSLYWCRTSGVYLPEQADKQNLLAANQSHRSFVETRRSNHHHSLPARAQQSRHSTYKAGIGAACGKSQIAHDSIQIQQCKKRPRSALNTILRRGGNCIVRERFAGEYGARLYGELSCFALQMCHHHPYFVPIR